MRITERICKLIWSPLVGLLLSPTILAAAAEERFDVLRIGTQEYQNVTVTTKAREFICILHSRGIGTIKVTDLSDELQIQLGYKVEKKNTGPGFSDKMSAQMDQTLARLNLPGAGAVQTKWANYRTGALGNISDKTLGIVALVIVFVGHLFFCTCCYLICKKTDQEPGLIVWVPGLQIFPLLRAAGMSAWWFFAFLLPVISLIAYIVWCVKISRARGKSGLTAFFLIFPPTSLLAFLYLAFSSTASKPEPKEDKPKHAPIMTLETA